MNKRTPGRIILSFLGFLIGGGIAVLYTRLTGEVPFAPSRGGDLGDLGAAIGDFIIFATVTALLGAIAGAWFAGRRRLNDE